MPIATCIVNERSCTSATEIIEQWSEKSGINSEHMTINIVNSAAQFGKQYKIMATLQLPSIWSSEKVSALQLGLANALSACFKLSIDQVHVVTTIIDSGLVVENGEEISW